MRLEHLLPHHHLHSPSPTIQTIPPEKVKNITTRLRYLVEQLIHEELEPSLVISPESRIITPKVIELVWDAGGTDEKACLVFTVLECRKYFRQMISIDLANTELHTLRMQTCERIAKLMINGIKDDTFLFSQVLLQKYSTVLKGKPTVPVSVVERAVNAHIIHVINAPNFQRCVTAIWRGHIQIYYHPDNTLSTTPYRHLTSTAFWDHYDTRRMRVPLYQNLHKVLFTFLYLVLYTIVVNGSSHQGTIGKFHGLLFFFAFGFFCDEIAKIYKGGRSLLQFWRIYSVLLHSSVIVCFLLRVYEYIRFMTGGDSQSKSLSTNLLACLAPFIYCRQLLSLDFLGFFGTMLIVLKRMVQESVLYFLLLFVIVAGFLQGFFALDSENGVDVIRKVIHSMTQAFLDSPDFELYEDLSPPFGLYLFYLYNFMSGILLLNILIALFNQAYSEVTENAVDEFLASFTNETVQYIQAPDEHPFYPPFNLIRVLFLAPFDRCMSKWTFTRLNAIFMGILYFPTLSMIALYESKIQARRVRRDWVVGMLGAEEGASDLNWQREVDPEMAAWAEKVRKIIPRTDGNSNHG